MRTHGERFEILTIGVMLSSCRSISPCSKNSDVTKSATRFSIGHGFVIADKSHTVMLIARKSDRGSSLNQLAIDVCGFTSFKNEPRFLFELKKKRIDLKILFCCVRFCQTKEILQFTGNRRLSPLTEWHLPERVSLGCILLMISEPEFDFQDCSKSWDTDRNDDVPWSMLNKVAPTAMRLWTPKQNTKHFSINMMILHVESHV